MRGFWLVWGGWSAFVGMLVHHSVGAPYLKYRREENLKLKRKNEAMEQTVRDLEQLLSGDDATRLATLREKPWHRIASSHW